MISSGSVIMPHRTAGKELIASLLNDWTVYASRHLEAYRQLLNTWDDTGIRSGIRW